SRLPIPSSGALVHFLFRFSQHQSVLALSVCLGVCWNANADRSLTTRTLYHTALRTSEIEDVILFSVDGVACSLNRPSAIMTAQGGSRAHIRECEAAIPDNPAPT